MHSAHTILVVDDEPAIREMLEEVLVDEGHGVTLARDGADALAKLRDGQERPCAIVLDLVMPRMTGWELAAALRSDPNLAKIPFMVMGANPRYESDAHELGAQDWFGKPLELDRLVQALDDVCGACE
jgi:CheY-like chemotaxis protein